MICQMIDQCGCCNPYCSEYIKIQSLVEMQKEWWNFNLIELKPKKEETDAVTAIMEVEHD